MNDSKKNSDLCGPGKSGDNLQAVKGAAKSNIDPETIDRLKGGDPDAFKAVYMTYHMPLEKFLAALLRSPSDAEEFAQQIMLEIWEKRSELDPAKSIGGLVYTMAKRKAFSFIRHRYVEQKYAGEAVSADGFSHSGEEIVIAAETEILQEYILGRMSERRRRIYEMSRKEGMSYKEISERLNISQKTVEYHISQALKDFREVLALFIVLVISK